MTEKEERFIDFAMYISNRLSCGISRRLSAAMSDIVYNVNCCMHRAINLTQNRGNLDRDDLLDLEESLEKLIDIAEELKKRTEQERIEIFENEEN